MADVEAAERDYKKNGSLTWLKERLQLRETKTNFEDFRLEVLESGSTDHSDSDDAKPLDIEAE